MHFMLADDIDGGILALMIFGGGLITAVIALIALFPAAQNRRTLTFYLVAPAVIAWVVITSWLAYGVFTAGLHDRRLGFRDFLGPWIILAGPAFMTSFLALVVLWVKSRKAKAELAIHANPS